MAPVKSIQMPKLISNEFCHFHCVHLTRLKVTKELADWQSPLLQK